LRALIYEYADVYSIAGDLCRDEWRARNSK
jgi:hypothetical protein